MASTKKPNHSAKVKYWSDGVTGECNGSIVMCIEMLFLSIPKEKQIDCLSRLNQAHTRMIEKQSSQAA
ncbi:hypothetical protein ACTVNB_22165 [Serratia nematodiphila]